MKTKNITGKQVTKKNTVLEQGDIKNTGYEENQGNQKHQRKNTQMTRKTPLEQLYVYTERYPEHQENQGTQKHRVKHKGGQLNSFIYTSIDLFRETGEHQEDQECQY